MTTEFKLVPVETLKFALGITRHGFKNRTDQEADKYAALKTITEILESPTPPQPIYDEEVVAWEVTGGGVKPGVFTFKPGWAVDDPAYTVRELVYAQSRAKAGEVDHE